MKSCACVVLIACMLTACGAQPAASSGTERAAIVGGEPSTAADDAVVQLRVHQTDPTFNNYCSGTLVAKNLVLTALHCAAVYAGIGVAQCQADGSLVPPDNGVGWIGGTLPPGAIDVYFGLDVSGHEPDAYSAEIFGSGATEVCVDDIALVVLDRDLPAPPMTLRMARNVELGESVSVMGYGSTGVDGPVMRMRRDGIPVTAVGPDELSHGVGAIAPRAFLTDVGPCAGDTGGPALSEETGAIVGVFGRGISTCTEHGPRLFTKVAPYASLLRRAFYASGNEPLEEADAAAKPAPASGACGLSRRRAPAGHAGQALATILVFALGLRKRNHA